MKRTFKVSIEHTGMGRALELHGIIVYERNLSLSTAGPWNYNAETKAYCFFHRELSSLQNRFLRLSIQKLATLEAFEQTRLKGNVRVEKCKFDSFKRQAAQGAIESLCGCSNCFTTDHKCFPVIIRDTPFNGVGNEQKYMLCGTCIDAAPYSALLSFVMSRPLCINAMQYEIVCGEIEKNGSIKANFFATKSINSSELSVDRIEPVTVATVRNHLANFTSLFEKFPKETNWNFKLNTRLKLGFSSTYPTIKLFQGQIIMRDDIRSLDGGAIMTDGCGFISASLADKIPFGIISGRPSSGATSRRLLRPAVVQIRLSCHAGLFKGCLIVCDDEQVCSRDCVVVRPSMRKADGPLRLKPGDGVGCWLNVNNTFQSRIMEVLGGGGSKSLQFADLNFTVISLLSTIGAPSEYFVTTMFSEIERVVVATTDLNAAKRLVKRAVMRQQKGNNVDPDLANHASEEDDNDDGSIHTMNSVDEDVITDDFLNQNFIPPPMLERPKPGSRCSSVDLNAFYSMSNHPAFTHSEKAWQFLTHGHAVTEPELQSLLKYIQLEAIKKLREPKLRIPDAGYFVGVPDPLGVLAPGEVFVALSNPAGNAGALQSLPPGGLPRTAPVIEGLVAVTRSPCYLPGDIRILKAVGHAALKAFFAHTSGDVVVFSTQGQRSPADEMAGGDFDGDEYLVIANKEIVSHLVAVDPFPRTFDAAKASKPSLGSPLRVKLPPEVSALPLEKRRGSDPDTLMLSPNQIKGMEIGLRHAERHIARALGKTQLSLLNPMAIGDSPSPSSLSSPSRGNSRSLNSPGSLSSTSWTNDGSSEGPFSLHAVTSSDDAVTPIKARRDSTASAPPASPPSAGFVRQPFLPPDLDDDDFVAKSIWEALIKISQNQLGAYCNAGSVFADALARYSVAKDETKIDYFRSKLHQCYSIIMKLFDAKLSGASAPDSGLELLQEASKCYPEYLSNRFNQNTMKSQQQRNSCSASTAFGSDEPLSITSRLAAIASSAMNDVNSAYDDAIREVFHSSTRSTEYYQSLPLDQSVAYDVDMDAEYLPLRSDSQHESWLDAEWKDMHRYWEALFSEYKDPFQRQPLPRYIEIFDRHVLELYNKCPECRFKNIHCVRNRLARIVYKVVYAKAFCKSTGSVRVPWLNFCWQICGNALHDHKLQTVVFEASRTSYNPVNISCMDDL